MSRRKPIIFLVVLIHVVVIGVLWLVPAWLNRMKPMKPLPDAMFVSLVMSEPSVADVQPIEVAQPDPPPAPEPEPVAPPKPKKKKIEISKKKIVRDKPPEPQKRLTPEEIRKQLQLQGQSSPNAVEAPLPAWYYDDVRKKLYAAWSQPASLSAASGHQVKVQLRVARDGRIITKDILRRSGQPEMDQSVQAALSAVTALGSLPPQYSGATVDITITFELNRG